MIRVGVIGALGKMGREVCRAVDADPDCTLVAGVDVAAESEVYTRIDGHEIVLSSNIDTISQAEAHVVVDFTHPDAVLADVEWCIGHAIDVVVGTTGLTDADIDGLRALLDDEGNESNVFIAPNFAIGAVLMMRFAAEASRYLPQVEIIEMHHDGKADAPSGTALATARAIAAGRSGSGARAVDSVESIPGARGADVGGVQVHSVRMTGFVAHQEVILGGPGQTLTIRHDSTDRTSFMPGVLLAVKKIREFPGLTIGLDALLD